MEEWKLIQEFLGLPHTKVDYEVFVQEKFNYNESWTQVMSLLKKVNEHIITNSPPMYQGIAIYHNRVWIDSKSMCRTIWTKGSRAKVSLTGDTQLDCVYKACIMYIKTIK